MNPKAWFFIPAGNVCIERLIISDCQSYPNGYVVVNFKLKTHATHHVQINLFRVFSYSVLATFQKKFKVIIL